MQKILSFIGKCISWVLMSLIKLYKLSISPWLGNRCRFTPSCSQYALQALQKHGPIKGTYYTIRRVLRCHPWGGHGYDSVP